MWRALLDRLRGRPVEHDLSRYRDALAAASALEPTIAALPDAGLPRWAGELRARLPAAPSAPQLAEVFALAREAARRALGQRPFDEQLLAGLALAEGRVVEMATGEGKTLAAVAPAFLHALCGRGVHVLTFNDYLARRDAAWMGPVYERLGLSVGFVQEKMSPDERRRAYASDVTYLTAKEAGFDHLRDGLCLEPGERVQRAFHFALVDEADSILIDEARIPLVIAGEAGDATAFAERLAALVRTLVAGRDFDTDEHAHNIALTEEGALRVEAALACGSLHAAPNLALHAGLRHALHALHLLRRDVDYIVRDGRVELVDDSTGRVADKRHWPDGLQAAVEAKEGLRPSREGRILGSITLQHFLSLYPRLAGMTATAQSAAEELQAFYGLRTVAIPTHRPCVRLDRPDLVFTHREAKEAALVEEIREVHAPGRPILVGTASVAESEALALALLRAGVPCVVLNAKNDEAEAEVVARAGAAGAVTISTNMAGRGTDIRLGGPDEGGRDAVVALGGLYVIGTSRQASLRIDRQLRGRAGRQGDPGSSVFFVSLEDDLIRRYGVEQLITPRHLPQRQQAPVRSRLLQAEIARAQRIVEDEGFQLRRTLFGYSDIVERQRRAIQRWRSALLERVGEPGLLAERAPERWAALRPALGEPTLGEIERRLLLVAIDRCWSDHLAELRELREDGVLLAFAGRFPLAEFHQQARESFTMLEQRIEDEAVVDFERLTITEKGVDWDDPRLRGPSATWTYLVGDNPFGASGLLSPAGRTQMLSAVAGAPWLVLLYGAGTLWRRRRDRSVSSGGGRGT
ncbi:MAG TPA: accessory Sec system translocase SecA2 [Vicinamibacteria bacterium]|nr:accessory Sec system translocase SecA2 [Vicinamibacteria bacterium]